jgi:uncharacterized protein YdhG (YjbR/CyaY superfamily)
MNNLATVDEYIASTPQKYHQLLNQLRNIIKQTAPTAIEKISYSMPYYHYKGRLAYFRLAKNHLGLFIPPPVIEEHNAELKKYSTSAGTLRLPLDKQLPIRLIQKLIRARMKINDMREKTSNILDK